MNLQTAYIGGGEIPPIPCTSHDYEIMRKGYTEPQPFKVNDLVVPRMETVYAMGESIKKRNPTKINSKTPLRVKSMTRQGNTYKVQFVGVSGTYESTFFDKK